MTCCPQEADVPFDVYRTSCQRMEVDNFHEQGQQRAGAEVAALYEYVQKMPEGPQKAHFMKRVSGTVWGNEPPSYPHLAFNHLCNSLRQLTKSRRHHHST